MKLIVDDKKYNVEIEKKIGNRNTYIRVKKDMTIQVTTNRLTRDKEIEKLLEQNYDAIVKMIEAQSKKINNNSDFHYLGKRYDIIYTEYCDVSLGEDKVFLNKQIDIDKWYKNQAKTIFKEHLDQNYENFSENIPYPSLRIRKMTSRWGVCNIKSKTVTLNLELIKRDTKYLDYVIIHELSHLIHPNHSADFWSIVEKNMPGYKKLKKEMKEF